MEEGELFPCGLGMRLGVSYPHSQITWEERELFPRGLGTGLGVPVLIFSWRANRDVFCSDCPLTEVPLQKSLQRKEFVYLSTYKLLWLEHSSVTYLQYYEIEFVSA